MVQQPTISIEGTRSAWTAQRRNIFFVEDVGYQKAAIQEMERMMLPVVGMKPQSDRRSRLQVVAQYVENGTVLLALKDVVAWTAI